MFVKVSLDYEWYGPQKDVAFVGPFPGHSEASKWQAAFQFLMLKEKLTGEVVVCNERERGALYSGEETPEQVHKKMYDALYKYCMG
mgnify:CR=1 FL=1